MAQTNTQTLTLIYAHVHTHTHTPALTHTHTHTSINTYTHTQTHTHTYTHTEIQFLIRKVATEVNWNGSTVKKRKVFRFVLKDVRVEHCLISCGSEFQT